MIEQQKKRETAQKRKALEPQERFCHILKKKISILVEYPDYHGPLNKGTESTLYCGNILPCFHNDVHCKYSGISPLYRDPFIPTDSELAEDEETL